MRLTTIFLCLVLLLAIPAALLADRDDRRDDDRNYRDRDDRQGHRIWRDNDRFNDRQASVNFTGTIKEIEKRGDRIEISVGRRHQDIHLTRDTDIYNNRGRSTGINSLRKGERIHVIGYETRRGEIIATRIYLGDEPRDYRFERTIEVKVVRDTALLGRKLKVEPVNRNRWMPDKFTLEVNRRAEISLRGRELSVQDLRVGDILKVEGRWEGTTFIAEKIRVNESCDMMRSDHRDR